MNRTLSLSLVFCSLVALLSAATTPNGFTINRGVNISHWLSQVLPTENSMPNYDVMFTEMDAALLASVNFDHVRLPIDEKEMWDEAGAPIEANWSRLLRGIEQCLRHDLRVIVDLHIVRSHHFNAIHDGGENSLFDDPAAQELFLNLWRQISARLQHFPNDQVAYEFMNEAVADEAEDWNQLLAASHATLRALEPERTVVMGSNRWQSTSTFPELRVPEGDPNIILSFHNYSPMLITHRGASWVPSGAWDGPFQYPGVSVDRAEAMRRGGSEMVAAIESMGGFDHHSRETLAAEVAVAVARAEALGLPLYCGEFGSLGNPGRDIRLQYYRNVVSVFKQFGISYSNWDYKGSFRIVDPVTFAVDHELISILTGHVAE